uniref:non-specific serine/threonine protein kinase n=1 Tax=Candidatus Kentrum sp. TC TaxID=2126339 RepID=A0A450YCM6_9GAMM|nr:MAG: Leucine rich repeat-containing protein [Candidatus Kentron sp. TC]
MKNKAYYEAEKKIQAALESGATKLDLSAKWDAEEAERLAELPESLGRLTRLQELFLYGNQLTALPESLSRLTRLQRLHLAGNQLTALPESLSRLTRLERLGLAGNQLTALPESLGRLTQLQGLSLAGNQLTTLPESLGRLTRLQGLSLAGNQLTALPESLGRLARLQGLSLAGNQLTTLPESLDRLAQLRTLFLDGNQLTALPESLSRLTRLQRLHLAGNQLTALPESLGRLAQLRTLFLAGNRLTALPESLGRLTRLQGLWLTDNQLTALPESLGRLTQLQKLDLDDNPLAPELAAAYKEGTQAVLRYLRAQANAQITLNQAKLILVGEGEVGKTCLMDALEGLPWREHDTTHGIEIRPTSVIDSDSGKEITLNGWDFGGQRVYRPTHQLFFSAPAVYLVVWKPREGPQAGFVREWISLVKHREPEARMLIVATHGGPGQRQPDIDRQGLLDLFGEETIRGFFHVESKPDENGQRRGVGELKKAIAGIAAKLPEVGRKVPKRWQETREALEKTGAAWLTLDAVFTLCRERGMIDEEARLFVTLSHRLGHLIHYEHDPLLRDMVVLKPDWLATAISFVLDDQETRAAHGLARFSRLRQLWDDPERPDEERYDPALHPLFLRLMERFDLSYRVAEPERKGKNHADADPASLIAQLVPDIRPEARLRAEWPSEPASGDTQQVQVCRIVDDRGQSATAEGIFYQLIVRLHKFSLGREDFHHSIHWQRGLVLDDGYNGRAYLAHIGNDIRITARAPYPAYFLGLLVGELKWLVESFWEGLRCQVTLPCPALAGDGKPCPGLFEVEKLVDSKKKNRPEHPCPVCNEWQSIDALLSNAPPVHAVTTESALDRLLTEFADVKRALVVIHERMRTGFAQLDTNDKQLLSRIDETYADLLQALTDEAKDGPRLFSLEPVNRRRFNPKEWAKEKFRITLWCEHSRLPLPVLYGDENKGVCEIELDRTWFKKAAPFLRVLNGALRLGLPVAAAGLESTLDEATHAAVEGQLDSGQEIIEASLKSKGGGKQIDDWPGGEAPDRKRDRTTGSPISAHGATLRELHAMLKKQDPGCKFGGLVRVRNKKNEFLWVHPRFEGEY